jgi:hypothetical protein
VVERELPDAEVVISQPFWPAYLTAERIAKAKKLKLAVTAGIGSDHSSRWRRERAPASLGLPPNATPLAVILPRGLRLTPRRTSGLPQRN